MRRVAAVVCGMLALSSCSVFGTKGGGGTVTAWFPQAVALYASSDVRVLGLTAGSIKEVKPVGGKVRVTMKIDQDVALPRDVHAMLVPSSLIGERYVQLYPAWKVGDPRAPRSFVIPEARTSVPVEPDEALAALKRFLDALDPNAAGRLVKNLSTDLKGTGPSLNQALKGLADVTSTIAGKDEALGRIIDQFDAFTAVLRTREGQLGEVMDNFAQLTGVLAQERRSIEGLVKGLAQLANDALTLVSKHGTQLDHDLGVVTHTLQAVDANLTAVKQLLESGPVLVKGLKGAVDPTYHRIDLRSQFSPTVQQALVNVLGPLGIPIGDVVCLPIDVACTPNPAPAGAPSTAPGAASVQAPAVAPTVAPPPTSTPTTAPRTTTTTRRSPGVTLPPNPLDQLLGVLAAPAQQAAPSVVSRSTAEKVGGGVRRVGRFLGHAAGALFGGWR
jgi:phospholipid/cholesterol/gamma-HCH transport system substrate-binding protein